MQFKVTMSRKNPKITEALTTEDLWQLMRLRVPPVVSEYFRGGADSETTLRANVRAFNCISVVVVRQHYEALNEPKRQASLL